MLVKDSRTPSHWDGQYLPWHGPGCMAQLQSPWGKMAQTSCAVARVSTPLLHTVLSATRLDTQTHARRQTHGLRIAKAQSTAKSTHRPWEDKPVLWPNTLARAAKTNLDHSVAKGVCDAVALSWESQCLVLHLSGKIHPRWKSGRGGGREEEWRCGENSRSIKHYIVLNTSFSIPADSIPRQCNCRCTTCHQWSFMKWLLNWSTTWGRVPLNKSWLITLSSLLSCAIRALAAIHISYCNE